MGDPFASRGTSWFRALYGVDEYKGVGVQAFDYNVDSGVLTAPGGKTFRAGFFSTPALAELRKEVKVGSPAVRKALGGRLQVREVVGDVSKFHCDPENALAVFQAASQFNTLEHTSQNGRPEAGIAIYSMDRTQGPACAIACSSGTLVRNYFADLTQASTLKFAKAPGQTSSNQIENLGKIEAVLDNASHEYFRVRAGYVLPGPQRERALSKLEELLTSGHPDSAKLRDNVMAALHIGLQRDTEVSAWGFGAGLLKQGERHLVTQAYCSALSVAYSGISARYWTGLGKLVLDAAYEATILAAVQNALHHKGQQGSKRVFLTALGGGVFGNPDMWIVDAIRRALDKVRHLDLEVFIVSFGHSSPAMKALAAACTNTDPPEQKKASSGGSKGGPKASPGKVKSATSAKAGTSTAARKRPSGQETLDGFLKKRAKTAT
eukprot:TRINITY_DN30193_c0_g1_i2.p1 TRINITY_DN30193_c0_g1~~TRINITY_DN30193_c0_g1_i2.p1  ORF type:complete len:435 (+),score=97.35 TRINITY_DN30193_c0_g1_i2:71-1375(+)